MVDDKKLGKDQDHRIDRFRRTSEEFPVEEATVRNDPDFFEHGRVLAVEGPR